MSNINFITRQDILNSLSSPYTGGIEKNAWFSAVARRALTTIPSWFMGRNWGLQGTMRGINRLLGGGRTRMVGNGATKVFQSGRGMYNTNTGKFWTDTLNKGRNWILDKTHAADKYLGRQGKRLARFENAAQMPTSAKIVGTGAGLAGYTALSSVPVLGNVVDAATALTPAGALWQAPSAAMGAYNSAKNYITDKYVVPAATNAAYDAMNSTLQGVNNMTTMQRLGFLLAPQQAQAQMQAQAEQEFARQAFARQQELWKQRRGEN